MGSISRSAVHFSVAAILAVAMLATSAQAQQQNGPPNAPQQAQPDAQKLAQQQQSLQQLLQNSPNGGGDLIRGVRNMLMADHSALGVIIGALKNSCGGVQPCANSNQQTAIGTALGLVAQALLATDRPFATEIQRQLAEAGNDNASTAFASITGNVEIGAGGGGGGGGGGGSGGPTGSGLPQGGPNTGFNGFPPGFVPNGNALTGGIGTGTAGTITSQF